LLIKRNSVFEYYNYSPLNFLDKKKKTSTEIMFLTLVEVLAAYYCSNERAILFDADSTSIRSSSEIDWKRTSGKGYKVGR